MGACYLVPLVLYILEIVETLVVKLILHPPHNTLSILGISPSETSCVVVKTVFQFPCLQLIVLEISVTLMKHCTSVLIQCFLIIRHNDYIKGVSRAPCFSLRRGRHEVCDAV